MKYARLIITYIFWGLQNYCFCHEEKPEKALIEVCAFLPESPYAIDDWISYHRAIGIERFFCYYHPASYLPKNIREYKKQQWIEFIPWPKIDGEIQGLSVGKIAAYEHACKYVAKAKTKWLIYLDPHEYLVPTKTPLCDLLKKYADSSSLSIESAYYAHELNAATSCTKARLLCLPKQQEINPVAKVFFQPAFVTSSELTPYKHRFSSEKPHRHIEKNTLRVNTYLPKLRKNTYKRKTIFCDPGHLSLEEIKEGEQKGYTYIDATYAIDTHKKTPEKIIRTL